MTQDGRLDYESLVLKLNEIRSWTWEEITKDNNGAKIFSSTLKRIVNDFSDRLRVDKREFVFVISISTDVVPRRLVQYCKYIGGKYVGVVFVDLHGNFFKTAEDAQNYYGDRMVLSSVGDYMGVKTSKAVYIPEIEMVLIGSLSQYPHFNLMELDDSNTYLQRMSSCEPTYTLIDKEHYVYCTNNTVHTLHDCYVTNNSKIDGLMEAIKPIFHLRFGVVNIGGNNYVPLDTLTNIQAFVKYKAKLEHKNGKVQNKIDELVASKHFICEASSERMPHEYENLTCKTHINKIDDNRCVIRWTYSYRDECFDGMRVYIDGTDVYACKSNNSGQYVRVALSTLNQKNFSAEYNSEIELDDMTGTRLEWYSSVINALPKKHRITILMLFLTDVKIEQLVKLGFGEAICEKIESTKSNIGPTIRAALRVNQSEENGKNTYKWLGINKHQLAAMIDYCKRYEIENQLINAIADMKSFFAAYDISAYDNQLFDDMLRVYEMRKDPAIPSWGRQHVSFFSSLVAKAQNNDDSGVFKNNMLRYIPTLLTMTKWNNRETQLYYDYIDMVCKMNIRSRVKLYPATIEDLKSMHDSTYVVYNMHKTKYQRDAFVGRVETWKKMEYENDDFDFCVKAPTAPEDLAVEGLQLHHCVRSYIDRVANGQTTVLFVRKKDDVETPFFTVEVSNDRVIRQVHGFGNRNANTEPGMEDFIRRWATNKRLKIGAFNVLRG